MQLTEFRDLVLTADSNASHYDHKGEDDYTVWAEYGKTRLTGDNSGQDHAWKIQVDRFTRTEYDPIVEAITAMLEAQEIPYTYLVDYEPTTRYAHHIWDCEVA